MQKYRVIVNYQFKKGMEQQGLKFLENELVKKAQQYGCHNLEIWHSEKEPSHVVGIGYWDSIEDARRFQAIWNEKETQLQRFCTNKPQREFFKVKSVYTEKAKKAA